MDRRSWRGVWVLAVAMLAAGTLAITPATAGKFLTKKRALKLFYTKAQANAAYVNVGEKATSAGSADTAADADKLDGLDSTQLSPAGGAGRTEDLALTDMFDTVLTATVATPGSALLLTSASVDLLANGGDDDRAQCTLEFDNATEFSPTFRAAIPDTSTDRDTLSIVWAESLGPGAHTVDLLCQAIGTVTIDNASLTVAAHV